MTLVLNKIVYWAKDPCPPPWYFLYQRETYKCHIFSIRGVKENKRKTVHLKTHAPQGHKEKWCLKLFQLLKKTWIRVKKKHFNGLNPQGGRGFLQNPISPFYTFTKSTIHVFASFHIYAIIGTVKKHSSHLCIIMGGGGEGGRLGWGWTKSIKMLLFFISLIDVWRYEGGVEKAAAWTCFGLNCG